MEDREVRKRQRTDVGAQYPKNAFTKGRTPQQAQAAEQDAKKKKRRPQ